MVNRYHIVVCFFEFWSFKYTVVFINEANEGFAVRTGSMAALQ